MFKKITAGVIAFMMILGSGALQAANILPETAVTASADDEEILIFEDYKYKVLDDGTVGITKYTGTEESLDIPGQIDGKAVTRICETAFYGNKHLISVFIPDSVTAIGASAFGRCLGLINIGIPESVTEIENNPFHNTPWSNDQLSENQVVIANNILLQADGKLTEFDIPFGVTRIGEQAFTSCFDLERLTIPNSVQSIGTQAFMNSKLTELTIPASVVQLDKDALFSLISLKNIEVDPDNSAFSSQDAMLFDKDKKTLIKCAAKKESLYLPETVEEILPNAFLSTFVMKDIEVAPGNEYFTAEDNVLYDKDKTRLIICGHNNTELTIPDSVTDIDDRACENCSMLTKVSFGKNVKNIGSLAFARCKNLSDATFSDGLKRIENGAFEGCYALNGIDLPKGLSVLGEYAFSDCKSLSRMVVPEGVIAIRHSTFRNCSSLKSVTLPDGVTIISPYAFEYCSALESINIPDGVKKINNQAFYGCKSLKSIDIPGSVIDIYPGAFESCTSLESVRLEYGVNMINDNAFLNCPSLKSIVLPYSVGGVWEKALGYLDHSSAEKVKGFKIYCYNGTMSWNYAVQHGFDYELLGTGDVNGDGFVDIDDVSMIINQINGVMALDELEALRGNVDNYVSKDSVIDIDDATTIINHINGVMSIE